MRHEARLGEEQEEYLKKPCEADEALADTRRLTQEFAEMVRRLDGVEPGRVAKGRRGVQLLRDAKFRLRLEEGP
jgi:hypothetical protein